MTFGAAQALGNWDLGTSRHLWQDPRRQRFSLHGQRPWSWPLPSFYLPFKQAAPTRVLLPSGQASRSRAHPLHAHLGQRACKLLSTPVSMRPHTCQGPSTEQASKSKSPEQRVQCSSHGEGIFLACDSAGIRTHTTQNPGQTTHTHACTHTGMCTHIGARMHLILSPASSCGHFPKKTREQHSPAHDLFQELKGPNFQMERRKEMLRNPCLP